MIFLCCTVLDLSIHAKLIFNFLISVSWPRIAFSSFDQLLCFVVCTSYDLSNNMLTINVVIITQLII